LYNKAYWVNPLRGKGLINHCEVAGMIEFAKKVIVALLLISAFFATPIVLYYVLPHFVPFILAFLIALLLEPVTTKLVQWLKISRFLAANITYILFVGSLGVLVYFIVVKIISEVFGLIRTLERNIPQIQNWFYHVYTQTQDVMSLLPPEIVSQINTTYNNLMTGLANLNLISKLGSYTYNISTAIPNFFFSTLLFLIALYLIQVNLLNIQNSFYSYFKPGTQQKIRIVMEDLRNATIGFLQAQFILSTVTYLLSALGLWILKVKYAFAIALAIVIVDILPVLGTGSFLVPWAIFSIIRGNTALAIGLVILFLVITVVRKSIEPKVLGERIGLGPLATLISIWVGLKTMGILGVFLLPLLLIFAKALVRSGIIRYRLKI